jgi:hypothetical protein
MVPMVCPEAFVNNHQSVPRNVPEERISHLPGGGSLNSLESVEVFEIGVTVCYFVRR